MESGTKPLKVAEKYDVPRNTTWLLLGIREKNKVTFQYGQVSTKRKDVRVG